jgi:hypothetical protein
MNISILLNLFDPPSGCRVLSPARGPDANDPSERLPRREEAILLRNNYLSHRLPRILLGIPSYSNILDGLLIDILQELELQQVFGVVLGVEFLQPVAQDVVGVGAGLDGLFVQLPLRFGRGDQAEFC